MVRISRRALLAHTAAGLGALALPRAAFATGDFGPETHGLSVFGELREPADFKHFGFVNPAAPKGGLLAQQIRNTSGNQNFETFDTLNIYTFKGDGAAGMDGVFDTLMSGSGDEPGAVYGLVARAVRVSPDRLTYAFLLRPEARFHDGAPLLARDVAASLQLLKTKGHPIFRTLLSAFVRAEAKEDHVVEVTLAPERSRDLHLLIAGMPIFSADYWATRDFEASTLEAPLGSGPYKVAKFEQGRFIEFERDADYWGRDLPVNVGLNNFDRVRYEYFRERQVGFENFKGGTINYYEEFTSRNWSTGYDFPAVHDGRVVRDTLHNGAPTSSQGWYFNTRRAKFADPRIREAIGLAFDFEWTNKNIMFSSYKRLTSFFENSNMKAVGPPSAAELAVLEPFRAKLSPAVFGEPVMPPVSDGSGLDRTLLMRASRLLREAGCTRSDSRLMLPDGSPFEIEFLDSQGALQPHTQPFQANLRNLGIEAVSRIVDSAQYKRRIDGFDFDIVTMALGGSTTPGDDLRVVFGSQAAGMPGSRNMAGVNDPVVDALIGRLANAATRDELDVAARCLDRVLRAGRYWVPMWFRDVAWVAHWNTFDRPARMPKYGTGAPGTWWYDAKRSNKTDAPG